MKNWLLVLGLVSSVQVFALRASALPYADAFRVSTGSTVSKVVAQAASANQDWIVAYSRGSSTYINRYDGAGRVLVQESYIGQDIVDVAMDGAGNYAALRQASDGSGTGAFVTIYNRAGSVVVPEFRVNDTTAGDQIPIAIAMNATGQFAVVWTHERDSSTTSAVFAKRFQANGVAVARESVASNPMRPSGTVLWNDIAIDSQGNFIVVWDQMEPDLPTQMDVWARRFSSTGYPAGPAFVANTTTTNMQGGGRVACTDTGAFVVVWESQRQNGSPDWNVYGQRFGADGSRNGSEFQISYETTPEFDGEGLVNLAMSPDGGFVVTWSVLWDSPTAQVFARAFDRNATPIGQMLVANASGANAKAPVIAMDRDGNFAISWRQYDASAQRTDVYARRFAPSNAVVQPIANNQQINGLAGATGSFQYFKITVPPGQPTLDVAIGNGVGDADLYVRQGALPTLSRWDGRPYLVGNAEGVRMTGFPPGDWYIGIQGYAAYSGLSVWAHSY